MKMVISKIKVIIKQLDMSLTKLLNNQKVIIDPHGHYETDNWDDPRYEIHLHKSTKYKIEGKKCDVDIIVPLNHINQVRCKRNNKQSIDIPKSIRKEIQKAFEDSDKRSNFVKELSIAVSQYKSSKTEEDRIYDSLKKIGTAFGIDFSSDYSIIHTYTSGHMHKTFNIVTHNREEWYRISSNRYGIVLQDWSETEYYKHIKQIYH